MFNGVRAITAGVVGATVGAAAHKAITGSYLPWDTMDKIADMMRTAVVMGEMTDPHQASLHGKLVSELPTSAQVVGNGAIEAERGGPTLIKAARARGTPVVQIHNSCPRYWPVGTVDTLNSSWAREQIVSYANYVSCAPKQWVPFSEVEEWEDREVVVVGTQDCNECSRFAMWLMRSYIKEAAQESKDCCLAVLSDVEVRDRKKVTALARLTDEQRELIAQGKFKLTADATGRYTIVTLKREGCHANNK